PLVIGSFEIAVHAVFLLGIRRPSGQGGVRGHRGWRSTTPGMEQATRRAGVGARPEPRKRAAGPRRGLLPDLRPGATGDVWRQPAGTLAGRPRARRQTVLAAGAGPGSGAGGALPGHRRPTQ